MYAEMIMILTMLLASLLKYKLKSHKSGFE